MTSRVAKGKTTRPELAQAIDIAHQPGVPLKEILRLIDEGGLQGYRKDDRVWAHPDEAGLAATAAGLLPT